MAVLEGYKDSLRRAPTLGNQSWPTLFYFCEENESGGWYTIYVSIGGPWLVPVQASMVAQVGLELGGFVSLCLLRIMCVEVFNDIEGDDFHEGFNFGTKK